MRRSLLLLGPLCATAMLFACEDSDSSGNPNLFTADGATFEAGPPPEAGLPPEAAADAPPVATDVTVTVLRALGPAAGVTVVFHDAAGSILQVKKTGADGKATSSGATPAQATALLGGGSNKQLLTWTALEAGDEVFANDEEADVAAGTLRASLAAPYLGAASYRAFMGRCFGSADSQSPAFIEIFLSRDCVRPSSSVLASAFDPNNTLLAYAFKKGAPPSPADGGAASTTLGAWAAPGLVKIRPLNLPINESPDVLLAEISEGAAFFNEHGKDIGRITGTADFPVATGFAEAYQAAVRIQSGFGQSSLLVAKRVAPTTDIDLDLATALPVIDTGSVDDKAPARPEMKWTAAAPLTSTDGGSVHVAWWDGRDERHGWSFVVAPSATSVKAPALPPEAAEWAPRAEGDGGVNAQYSDPEVLFVEADVLPGFAAFRRDAGRVIPLAGGFDRDARAVLPLNGALRTTLRLNVAR